MSKIFVFHWILCFSGRDSDRGYKASGKGPSFTENEHYLHGRTIDHWWHTCMIWTVNVHYRRHESSVWKWTVK